VALSAGRGCGGACRRRWLRELQLGVGQLGLVADGGAVAEPDDRDVHVGGADRVPGLWVPEILHTSCDSEDV
jgi:hypothetical protein